MLSFRGIMKLENLSFAINRMHFFFFMKLLLFPVTYLLVQSKLQPFHMFHPAPILLLSLHSSPSFHSSADKMSQKRGRASRSAMKYCGDTSRRIYLPSPLCLPLPSETPVFFASEKTAHTDIHITCDYISECTQHFRDYHQAKNDVKRILICSMSLGR